MRVLIAYYSRTGHTERLALALEKALQSQGHTVSLEKISVENKPSKWRLVPPLLSTLPLLPLYLLVPPFRRWWLKQYPQAEQAISPLAFPDVADFDCVCIGGPKWLYIAYPLARYLSEVKGLSGKRIGAFATFCGPPLKVFELEMLFSPIQDRVEVQGGALVATLAVSSHFHEFFFFNEMEWVFRLVSRLVFRRSLRSFRLDSSWGQREVQRFCFHLPGSAIYCPAPDTLTPAQHADTIA
jgi:hypothetical protein